MASVFRNTYNSKKTGKKQQTKKWYIEFKDHTGTLRRLPGYTDHKLTSELGRKLDRLAAMKTLDQMPDAEIASWLKAMETDLRDRLAGWGLLDADSVAKSRPLTQHIEDFRQFMVENNNSPKHIALTKSRLTAMMAGCGFVFTSDLDSGRLHSWLARQRSTGAMSIKTSNYYQTTMKTFVKWLGTERRFSGNPFVDMKPMNAATDEGRQRRSMSTDELAELIAAARDSTKSVRCINGPDRAMLYLMASRTGLRAAELASLTRGSLRLDAEFPCVILKARDEKSRRGAVLPLSPDVVEELRAWLRERDDRRGDVISLAGVRNEKLWPESSWPNHAAKMMKVDLAAARKRWIEEAGTPEDRNRREESDRLQYADHDGRVFDFHSLRGQFVTDLGRAGVPLTIAQELARHSDPRLTSNFYTHLQASDLASSVGMLPSLNAKRPNTATGT